MHTLPPVIAPAVVHSHDIVRVNTAVFFSVIADVSPRVAPGPILIKVVDVVEQVNRVGSLFAGKNKATAAANQTVYVNPTGEVYHAETCSRVAFDAAQMRCEEAKERMGRRPCRTCFRNEG